jgi:hypothetical protein
VIDNVNNNASVNGINVAVSGLFPKTAKLRSEYFVSVDEPIAFIEAMKRSHVNADVFTFVSRLDDREPKPHAIQTTDKVAVMPISTYEYWFDKQLYFKPRNKLRKSIKAGVIARKVEFSDELILGIKQIYDETPIRQGKANRHYKKDFDTLKREHSAFLDRSDFIGVFFQDEMIGFVKVTHTDAYSVLMNIVAKICHRDKAPTNALVAKTVEICAARNSKFLMYGVWGARGLNDFKEANGFECFEVPRYYVPITLRGRLALQMGLHRRFVDIVPPRILQLARDARQRLISLKLIKRATAEQN